MSKKFTLPAFVEIEAGQFKSIKDCNYADVVCALRFESPARRRVLRRLLAHAGGNWMLFPKMTVGDMTQAS